MLKILEIGWYPQNKNGLLPLNYAEAPRPMYMSVVRAVTRNHVEVRDPLTVKGKETTFSVVLMTVEEEEGFCDNSCPPSPKK